MSDSISSVSDSELLAIMDQMRTAWSTNPADYPAITAAMKSDFDTLRDFFNDKINTQNNTQNAARAATLDRNNVRVTVEANIRNNKAVNKAGGVSDDKMAALGIPSSSTPAPANATVPVQTIDTSQRMKHTISWTDKDSIGNKRRPRGAMGAEIWVKIGDPQPGSEKDCVFLAVDSATPYVASYDPEDAGKLAYYMIRWRMRDGSVGNWGETVSATITA